ncbi:unnamed protein product [Larinioides sclopetarius]|uniref:Uncharacterized protein n=1 Tax=Larinioides sclopetarius TaxID=280406 RepID=A0AAV2BCU2_9ARAC
MQNLLCFTLVFLSAALSARGGIPDNMKSFFLPVELPSVHSEQNSGAASVSGSEEGRMAVSQSAIEEARRDYNAGNFSRYMMAKPIEKVECYVKETVIKHHPGRCIRLGGGIPACQSSDFMDFNYSECS